MFKKNLNLPNVLLIYSLAVLAVVYFLEYVLGAHPCKFCNYERIPYFIIFISSLIILFSNKYSASNKYYTLYKGIVLTAIVASIVYSSIHVGVENNLVTIESSCMNSLASDLDDLESFTNNIMQRDITLCNVVHYRFLGLSLASWNLCSSLFMLLFTSIKLKNTKE